MLKHRIITALIILPLFLLFLLKSSPIVFCLGTAILVLLGAHEWSSLMGVKSFRKKLIYPILMAAVLYASLYIAIPPAMYVAAAFWVVETFLVVKYPKTDIALGNGVIVRGLLGILVLVPAWLALNFIRNTHGPIALLFLFIVIWSADSAAYFAGKKWGKHKLAPAVSPGKSWEGLFGAFAMTIIVSLIALYLSATHYEIWCAAIALTVVTVFFSVVGDLFESMLKRKEGLKDSGVLLPGHGGILDRIDSITAAAPIYVVGLILLAKFYH